MVLAIIVHRCTKCNSVNIVRDDHDYKGDQKFYCHDCNAYGTLNPRGRYSEETKGLILRTYQKRASMRGIERIFGTARQTLTRRIVEKAAALPELAETLMAARPDDVLELDELWSFVLKKSNKRRVRIALCRRTRQIVAHSIGDRSEESCRELWNRIPTAYKKCRSYSDFWEAYRNVFPSETGQYVSKESGQTAHEGRWNNTLRQRLARFVGKTLSFSKSDTFHELALMLFIHTYNMQCAMS